MIVEKLSDNKDLINVINRIHQDSWSVFLSKDPFVEKYWRRIYEKYPEYQLLFKMDNKYIGVGNSAPIYWNGNKDDLPSGFDKAIETIIEDNKKPNTLCGLAAVISKDYLGRGISYKIINHFKKLAKTNNFSNLILPIRPTLKSKYPTISMENYIKWKKNELPFDPWLRVHKKLGGKILKLAEKSMIVRGTISDWQEWTGMYFGESNNYVVPGALNPIVIDLENNTGEYIEPNVWVVHRCK